MPFDQSLCECSHFVTLFEMVRSDTLKRSKDGDLKSKVSAFDERADGLLAVTVHQRQIVYLANSIRLKSQNFTDFLLGWVVRIRQKRDRQSCLQRRLNFELKRRTHRRTRASRCINSSLLRITLSSQLEFDPDLSYALPSAIPFDRQ